MRSARPESTAASADERVVDHDAAVGQHLALIARDEQQCGHACRHAETDGADGVAHRLHDVIERQSRLNLAAGAVDVERDGGVWILSFEEEEVADDAGARACVDQLVSSSSRLASIWSRTSKRSRPDDVSRTIWGL